MNIRREKGGDANVDDPKICPICDARWLEGQLYWNTGREACPHDLAGMVCNVLEPNHKCVNPCKGSTSGITWRHSEDEIDEFFDSVLDNE